MMRTIVLICGFVMSLIGSTAPIAAQANERCFIETGFCISGPVRVYWERNGGLAVFGYPITAQRLEIVEDRELPVQWFERDRLEIQVDGQVTAGRLGARLLELRGTPWRYDAQAQAQRGCTFFPETRHNICAQFEAAWNRMGGLERFGYPISEQRYEVIEGKTYTVQYFERRRMEYHPEFAGTPYEMLLGLLGRDILQGNTALVCDYINPMSARTLIRYFPDFGCLRPYNGISDWITIVTQPFQGGEMVWLPGHANDPYAKIIVIYRDSNGAITHWATYIDQYVEGEELEAATPPAGLYAPQRGFGKLWRAASDVRAGLGWATRPEASTSGEVLNFVRHGLYNWSIYRADIDRYYILKGDEPSFDI